jgi:hypothetical protein
MNNSRHLIVAALLGATASLAHAEAPRNAFAADFASMQALSSNSSQWQPGAPQVGIGPRNAPVALSLRAMQALNSDSPVWQPDQGRVVVDRGPTFAQKHPHGLAFAQYQAYASNSGEFSLPGSAVVPPAMPMMAAAGKHAGMRE